MKRSTGGDGGDNFNVSITFDGKELAEAQQLLEKFGRTAENISSGRNYHSFWVSEEEAINRVNEAYERYRQNRYDSDRANDLYKAANAFEAISGKNIADVFGSNVVKTLQLAEENASALVKSLYRVTDFKDAFDSFEPFSKGFSSVKQFQTAMDGLANSGSVEKLKKELDDAKIKIEELLKEIEELGDESWKKKYEDAVSQRQELINNMKSELWTKLRANDLATYEDQMWDNTGRFSEYFEAIENGSMTASEAFANLRKDLDLFGASADSISDGVIESLISKIDSLDEKIDALPMNIPVESASGGIREYADGVEHAGEAAASLSNANNITAESFLEASGAMEKIVGALKELITMEDKAEDSGERLSKVVGALETIQKITGDNAGGISDLSSALYRLANLDSKKIDTRGLNTLVKFFGSLKGSVGPEVSATLRELDFSKLSEIKIDAAGLKSIKDLAAGLKVISELNKAQIGKITTTLSGVDFDKLKGLDVKKSSLKNLAEYLPVIAKANAENLKKIGEADLTKFNNVKVSKASLEGIANLTESLRILQQTQAATVKSTPNEISVGASTKGVASLAKRTDVFDDEGWVSTTRVYQDAANGITKSIKEVADAESGLTKTTTTESENYAAVQKKKYQEAEQALRDYYTALTDFDKVKGGQVVEGEDGVFALNSEMSEEQTRNYAQLVIRLNEAREAYNKISPAIRNTTEFLKKEKELIDKRNKASEDSRRRDEAAVEATRKYKDTMSAATAAIEKLSTGENAHSSEAQAAKENISKLAEALKKEYEAFKQGGSDIDTLNKKHRELQDALKDNAPIIDGNTKSFKSLGSMIKDTASKFGLMLSTREIISRVTQTIKKMVSEVISLTDALAEMQIVTGATDSVMNDFADRAIDTSMKLGVSSNDFISGATTYARLGYTLEESSKLSEYTTMFQKVANIDASAAQDAITSIIKAYGKDVDDIEDVLNKLVLVGNNFPISASGIATGMTNMASAMNAAGNTFEQSVALLTAANTTVQDAARASTGLRTITARLRNTKVDLDELGEDMTEAKYEELLSGLTKARVSLYDDITGEYRSTYEVLYDLAQAWDTLSASEQAALATNLSGTRQQDIFYSIINQFREAEEAYSQMIDGSSEGMIDKAFSIYTNTATAHLNQFKETFRKVSKDLISSDLIKDVIDFGQKLLTIIPKIADFVQKIGGLKPILTMIIGMKTASKIGEFIKAITSGNLVTGAQKFGSAFATIVKGIKSGEIGAKNFGSSVTAAFNGAGLAASSLSIAIGGITAALSIAMAIYGAVKNAQEEQERIAAEERQRAMDAADATAEEAKSITEAYNVYAEARNALDGTTESKMALTSATDDLLDRLGDEGDHIRTLTDDYKGLNAEIEKQTAKKLFDAAEESAKGAIVAKGDAVGWLAEETKDNGLFSTTKFIIDTDTEFGVAIRDAIKQAFPFALLDLNTTTPRTGGYSGFEFNLLGGSLTGGVSPDKMTYDDIVVYYDNLVKLRDVFDDLAKDWDGGPEGIINSNIYRRLDDLIGGIKEKIDNVGDYVEDSINEYVAGEVHKRVSEGATFGSIEDLGNLENDIIEMVQNQDFLKGSLDGIDLESVVQNAMKAFPELKKLYDLREDRERKIGELLKQNENYDAATAMDHPSGSAKDRSEALRSSEDAKAALEAYRIKLEAYTDEELDKLYLDVVGSAADRESLLGVITDALFGKTDTAETIRNYEAFNKVLDRHGYAPKLPFFIEDIDESSGELKDLNEVFSDLYGYTDEEIKIVYNIMNSSGSMDLEEFENKIRDVRAENQDASNDVYEKVQGLTQKISMLGDVYKDVQDGGTFDWSKILNNENFKKAFGDCEASYDSFIKTITENSGDIGATQQAFNDLLSELLLSSDAFDNMTSAEAKTVAKMLEAQGVTNAEAVVTEILSSRTDGLIKLKIRLYGETGRLTNANYEEAASLVAEADASDASARALAQYMLAKLSANNVTIQTAADVENIIALANAAGASIAVLQDLIRIKAAFSAAEGALSGGGLDYSALRRLGFSDLNDVYSAAEKLTNGTFNWGSILDPNAFIRSAVNGSGIGANYGGVPGSGGSSGSGGSGGGSGSGENWFERAYKDWNHLVNMEQKTQEEYLDWLEDAYKQAAAEGIISQDDVYKYEEEVLKLRKSIFEQKISDFEHEVNMERKTQEEFLDWYVSAYDQACKDQILSAKDQQKHEEKIAKLRQSIFTEQIEDFKHEVSMERKTEAEFLDWYEKAYKEACDAQILSAKDQQKHEEEILKTRRSVFKDFVGDIKSMFDTLGHFDNTQKKSAALLEKQIRALEAEIRKAYADGLTLNDEHMQELLSEWLGAKDQLQGIYDDVAEKAKSSVQALVDLLIKMYKQDIDNQRDAIKKKLEILDDFYEKQKQMLRDERDEEKYLEEQAEKRRNVARIQQELAALDLDNSAWATKRKIELRKELADAQKELDDFEKDHALETTEKEIDDIQKLNKDALTKQDEALEKQSNNEAELIRKALEAIKDGNIDLLNSLLVWNEEYGDGIRETIVGPWEEAYEALQDFLSLYGYLYSGIRLENATGWTPNPSFEDYSVSGAGVKSGTAVKGGQDYHAGIGIPLPGDIDGDGKVTNDDLMLARGFWAGRVQFTPEQFKAADVNGDGKVDVNDWIIIEEIADRKKGKRGYASGTSNATPGIHAFDERGSEIIFESANGTKYKMFTGGEKVLNAKASNFLYNFATKGAELVQKIFGVSPSPYTPALAGAGGVQITQGDIIIEGDVRDNQTLSAIRRAQRESTADLLRQFGKLRK